MSCIICRRPYCDPHHEPRRGLGGNKNWRGLLVDICRKHHDELHDKRWYLEVTIEGYNREGELLFSRKLEDLEDE